MHCNKSAPYSFAGGRQRETFSPSLLFFTHTLLLRITYTTFLGYPLTKFTIRPFSDSELTNDPVEARRRRAWNRQLSRLRIQIEHAFGMLKGRFPTLRNMPGRRLDRIFKTIEALMVVHNILIEMDDDPYEIEGYNGDEDLGLFELVENNELGRQANLDRIRELDNQLDADLHRSGIYRRKLLLNGNY